MSNFYTLFIPLAPFIAALVTALPKKYVSNTNYKVGWWLMFVSFATALFVVWQAIQSPEPTNIVLFTTPWKFLSVVQLSIDRLAAVMMLLISGLCTLLYGYSTRYLQQDPSQGRYQTVFALKAASLLFMVSSADLVTLFMCWQLSSWFLCLLSHNYSHIPTAQGAFRTFIMLRGGALVFLAGIALAYHLYGTVEFALIFERAALDQTHFPIFGTGFEISGITAVTLLIFVGAMAKSVQFPLHMWLPDSLYAPTPIHALLHSGGINAGGFLLTRLAPLYFLSPVTLHVVLIIGLATAILGTSMMLVQNDIKKSLGYSTIGQMGYMIMECGLGAFSLAVFHLIAHGLFKADIFLSCGKGIQEARLHPEKPPEPSSESSFGMMGWIGAFALSLLVPLGITIWVHDFLGIAFLDNQGLLILLLFSWITSTQAMLTVYRLKKPLGTKIGMLFAIALIATAYFFAAEQFTHFLIPDHHVVESYFQAASLPPEVFMALAALLVFSIVGAWLFSVSRQQKGKAAASSAGLKQELYLFFMNRLYLDGIALRVLSTFKRLGRKIDSSPAAVIVVAVIGLVLAFGETTGLPALSLKSAAMLLLPALLVPLFPFHGVFVTALTKTSREMSTALSVLLPVLGLFIMLEALPEMPKALLPAISTLAIIGALWGSIKALMQTRVSHLLSYCGLALYSILWWYIAQTGTITPDAIFYTLTATLVLGGLFMAWDKVRLRYGDLDLNQIGGLFVPMPRFAVCMGLLIMAAVGLPPFGLFFGFLGILLSPSTGISFGLFAIIATWFAACWYLFKLMQRLLFGPYRNDLRYEDLRPAEVTAFVLVICLLILSSSISQDWLDTAIAKTNTQSEVALWLP